ncbi:hypothetical protein J1N35_019688 [Gossypium stocksii]|uniref:Pentatricopeptide repeat-containing protein n=1 Tax=Gossypium stocksii TaxID=47602 RepID=A0A9D4A054_9ROSI|nr:hypothetical protein J1N35_019688 [Gossypium stocksii]
MKIKGHAPNRPVYTMLITMCGRGGRFVEAANYLVEMTELGLPPISRCFDMVTDGLKNCGKHDLAKRIEQLELQPVYLMRLDAGLSRTIVSSRSCLANQSRSLE